MPTLFIDNKELLPERMPSDLYQTEFSLIDAFMSALIYENLLSLKPAIPVSNYKILDIGAYDGRWGTIAKANVKTISRLASHDIELYGVELQSVNKPDGYLHWFSEQPFLEWETEDRFDLIVSNPPYSKAEEFVRRGFDLMLDAGSVMAMLLPIDFMAGQDRYRNLWTDIPPVSVYICSRRPSFYGGKTNANNFAVFVWAKRFGKVWGIPRQWDTKLLYYERDIDQTLEDYMEDWYYQCLC